ncbi:hypothetical protein MAHJHV55_54970 [Mycobacterium avium subsp. hominissuis]
MPLVAFGDSLRAMKTAATTPSEEQLRRQLDDLRGYALTERPWLATDPTLDPWRPPGAR